MKLLGLFGTLLSCVTAFSVRAADNIPARVQAFESGLRPAVSVEGEPEVRWTVQERMAYWKIPALSVAVISHGQVAWTRAYGIQQRGNDAKVDTESVFSVGSLSKVAAASLTLHLVDEKKLDLDRPVNLYLKRWKVPESEFSKTTPVTLRGLLSHSAGLSVSGFTNYQPSEKLPSLVEIFYGLPPAKNPPVRLIYVPGTQFQYSGGGITVEELAVEEATNLSFPDAARKYLFGPLGMARSTYVNPLPANHGNIAKAHNNSGEPAGLPRGWEAMPEHAAAGLWSTPSDYAKLVIALIQSYHGDAKAFLSKPLAQEMMGEAGASQFGLGPVMTGRGFERRFTHSGGNASYRAYMEGNLATGNGIVIMTNGRGSLNLIHEVQRSIAAEEGYASPFSYQTPKVDIAPAQLDEFAGDYKAKAGTTLLQLRTRDGREAYHFTRKGEALYIDRKTDDVDTPAVDGKVRLTAIAANQFVFDEIGAAAKELQLLEFVRGYNGKITGLIVRIGDNIVEAEKVIP